MLTCLHCRKPLGWQVEYCPYCGLSQTETYPAEKTEPTVLPQAEEPPAQEEIHPLTEPAESKEKPDTPPANSTPGDSTSPPKPNNPPLRKQNSNTLEISWRMVGAVIITMAVLAFGKRFSLEDIKPIEPTMVFINGGCFQMGSLEIEAERYRDENRHPVCLKSFYMGKYEVTFEEYDLFAQATQRSLPKDDGYGRGRRPVSNIAWEDASEYAAWLSKNTGHSYRLPTEAEWEYAARAGTQQANYWGDTYQAEPACQYVNYMDCPNGAAQSIPVGALKPNAWGLYDMLGNVAEMTGSAYYRLYQGAETQQAKIADGPGRVMRGGSWHRDLSSLRLAWRGIINNTKIPLNIMGFRLARD